MFEELINAVSSNEIENVKSLLADPRVDASKVDIEKLKKFQSRSNEIIVLLNSSLRKNKIRNFL